MYADVPHNSGVAELRFKFDLRLCVTNVMEQEAQLLNGVTKMLARTD